MRLNETKLEQVKFTVHEIEQMRATNITVHKLDKMILKCAVF
jgi:hypothetical protein